MLLLQLPLSALPVKPLLPLPPPTLQHLLAPAPATTIAFAAGATTTVLLPSLLAQLLRPVNCPASADEYEGRA